jgi:hypothetical protein
MTLIEALEKTIEFWYKRLESDEHIELKCPLCKILRPGGCSRECPALLLDFHCGQFDIGYYKTFSQSEPTDKDTKDLVCEQAIGYADMLLQEEYAKEEVKS